MTLPTDCIQRTIPRVPLHATLTKERQECHAPHAANGMGMLASALLSVSKLKGRNERLLGSKEALHLDCRLRFGHMPRRQGDACPRSLDFPGGPVKACEVINCAELRNTTLWARRSRRQVADAVVSVSDGPVGGRLCRRSDIERGVARDAEDVRGPKRARVG
jgi:hypothetical protein